MKKGFSLLEIVISLVILGLTLAGIFSVFIAGRRYTERSKRKLVSFNVGRQVLEKLKEDVRQDTWGSNTNLLFAGTHSVDPSLIQTPADFNTNWTGTVNYVVGDIGGALRQATVTIKWNEPTE